MCLFLFAVIKLLSKRGIITYIFFLYLIQSLLMQYHVNIYICIVICRCWGGQTSTYVLSLNAELKT